jgi:hypothetical protein
MAMAIIGMALLSGCASTVTSEVTAFRQAGWQNDPPRTYAFDHAKGEDARLDRQTYEAWLADALAGIGFQKVARPQARYLVRMEYAADPRLVRVEETYYPDPWFPEPYWGPYRGPYWGPWGWAGPGWPAQTLVRDVPATLAILRVDFSEAASGRRVYEVTANHIGEGVALAAVMPYLIRSAFAEFPLENGRPRRFSLPVDKTAR